MRGRLPFLTQRVLLAIPRLLGSIQIRNESKPGSSLGDALGCSTGFIDRIQDYRLLIEVRK